jgi:uncharacterized YigZ family protein
MVDRYLTISSRATYEIKIQKSRFIANAFPVSGIQESQTLIDKIKKEYHDAGHNPFSYILFGEDLYRYYDDGEPSGSSGRPIYDAINKHSLKNLIVIVTRYFGGVKLGVGGLKRAYFEAADTCLDKCLKKEIVLKKPLEIEFDYKSISQVMQYIEKSGFTIKDNKSAERVVLSLEVPLSEADGFYMGITELTGGKVSIRET